MAEHSDCLPEVDIQEFIDQIGNIDWSAIDRIRSDHARAFVVAERLHVREWSPRFKKLLRDLMHQSKLRFTTFQLADRLFLALQSVSNGQMPLQARGSFEYMCWFHEAIDAWIEAEAQPTSATVETVVARTPYAGWDTVEFGHSRFLVDMDLCRKMTTVENLPFKLKQDSFLVEASATNQLICGRALYKAFTHQQARCFNDPRLGLCSDLCVSSLSSEVVTLQKSNYYSGIATNEAANLILHSRLGEPTVRGNVFSVEDGNMITLSDSLCSNQIGGNTLAFTSDGYLVLHVQKEDNLIGRGLAPSGSGSFDLIDAEGATNLVELIKNGTERELREESLVHRDKQTTRLIGFAICAHRGFKPDFFSVTKLKMTRNELREHHIARIASMEEFVGPHYYIEIGTSAADALSSIHTLLNDLSAKVEDEGNKPIIELPLGSVLCLALKLLHTHLASVGRSTVSDFLFE